jgi:hypothetical protein
MLKPILILLGGPGVGKYATIMHMLNMHSTYIAPFAYENPIDSEGNTLYALPEALVKATTLYRALDVSLGGRGVAAIIKEIERPELLSKPFFQAVLVRYTAEVERRTPLSPLIIILDSTIYTYYCIIECILSENKIKMFFSQHFLSSCCILHEFTPMNPK